MLRWSRTVERRCNACGTAWLLTKEQERFSRRHLRRPSGRGLGPMQRSSPQIANALALMGSQMAEGVDQNLEIQDVLRSCPKCRSEEFTDCRVTRSNPASPDASRSELP
jgi:hypothetical protein